MTTGVIGNSHTIAIKDAISFTGANPIDVRYFCTISRGWEINEMQKGGRRRSQFFTTPRHDGGDDSIFLDEFDNIVLSAGGWWAARNEHLDGGGPSHPLAFLACADWDYDASRVSAEVRLASVAVFETTVEAWIREQPIIQLLQRTARVCDGRIFLQPWPAPSRALKSNPDWRLNRWYHRDGPRAWVGFFLAQFRALQKITRELGPQVILLDYPLNDILHDGFMNESLCETDPFHGNKQYGALVLEQIAALI